MLWQLVPSDDAVWEEGAAEGEGVTGNTFDAV